MNKFNIVNQEDRTFAITKLQAKQQLNMRAVDMLSRGNVSGLFPVSISNEKKKLQLVYDITSYISLASFCSNVITKKVFFEIVRTILMHFRTVHEKYLHIEKVLLDLDFVMINPATKEICLLYVPIQEYDSNVLLKDFFLELVFKSIFDISEDKEYVTEYINFLKSRQTFSLYEFVKFIERLESDDTQEQYTPYSANVNTVICNHCGMQNVSDSQFCARCGVTMMNTAAPPVHGNAVSNPSMSPVSAVPVYPNQPPQMMNRMNYNQSYNTPAAPKPINIVTDPDATTILDNQQMNRVRFPYLIREKTGEKIILDKAEFRIGKDSNTCDYTIKNNTVISRIHANIITKSDGYYVYDHDSTNKTYLDGKAIMPKTEVAIFSGSKIRLANEDFVFYIM